MRKGFASIAIVGVAACIAVYALTQQPQSSSLYTALSAEDMEFLKFVSLHGKSYGTKEEFEFRSQIFKKTLANLAVENSRNENTFRLALNKFADWTPAEFKRILSYKPLGKNTKVAAVSNVQIPTSVDWRDQNAVNPVRDQGQCGSCWAFSTTGSVESAWFLSNGTVPELSEQQLVDCSTSEGNQGCNGGLMDYAFEYIIKNKGLTTEAAYPYTATGPNTCESAGKPIAATISKYVDVPVNSETALMTAIAQQPVSVAVEADQSVFQFYSGGVMDSTCGTQLDHGVLAVGYGTEGGKDYYKVKNSWGASWGDKGYILLGRGAKFNPSGQCGIQMAASYPVV